MDIDTLIELLNKYNDEGFCSEIRILVKGGYEEYYAEKIEDILLDYEHERLILVTKSL